MFWRVGLALLGLIAFVTIGTVLEDEVGISFDTTYRVVCAGMCVVLIYSIGLEYAGQRWPRVVLWLATLVNVGILFSPLVDRPASRGEVMLFAVPDVVIFLTARIVTCSAVTVSQRATRQQMILGLVVAIGFCAILFALAILQPRTTRGSDADHQQRDEALDPSLASMKKPRRLSPTGLLLTRNRLSG